MEKYCISVDWLQTFNHAAPLEEKTYYLGTLKYQVTKKNHETPLFLDVFEIRHNKMLVATILQRPRTSVMHPNTTTLKLENRILYSEQYVDMLYNINRALGLQYKGITRLDLCYDCNALAGGRSVSRFLRDFMLAEPLKKGHIIRSGSSRFSAHGTRQHSSIAKITSMRWGSPNNDITAYCYDKTLEMVEVKKKPWILEMWEKNGLQFDVDWESVESLTPKETRYKKNMGLMGEYVKKQVWRFEISITAHGKDIVDMSTGELFKLSPRYMENRDHIRRLFFVYAAKAFDFRINDGCTRIRDYKPLQIFETNYQPTAKPYHVCKSADTGRTEKICYNRLKKLSEEYNGLAEVYQDSLQKAMQFLSVLSGVKLETARLRTQANMLAEMRARQFLAEPERNYLRVVAAMHKAKTDINPELIYDLIYKADISAAERLTDYQQAPPPKPDFEFSAKTDLTPEDYIW